MLGAVDDFRSIIRPERSAVIAKFIGELLHVRAIGIHGKNVQVTVACRSENDMLAVASDGRFSVVSMSTTQLSEVRAIRLGDVDLVGTVDWPDVTVRVIRLGRAIRARRMRRREKNPVSRRKEVAAGGSSLASANELGRSGFALGRVYRHGVNLIAGHIGALMLEDQLLVVGREVRFGILAAESKLASVFQMLLFLGQKKGFGLLLLSAQANSSRRVEAQERQQAGHDDCGGFSFFHKITCDWGTRIVLMAPT